jgi:hypothetical protein
MNTLGVPPALILSEAIGMMASTSSLLVLSASKVIFLSSVVYTHHEVVWEK